VGVLVVHANQLDFEAEAPWQFCGFIAQSAVPTQWRPQINAPGVDQADDVTAWKRLIGDPGPQRAEEKPTGYRDNRCFIESRPLQKNSRDENEETAGDKTRGKPSPGSG
jgi:hypothetical protein